MVILGSSAMAGRFATKVFAGLVGMEDLRLPNRGNPEVVTAFRTKTILLEKQHMTNDSEDKTIYKVVLNHEEQYSIWPAHRENALGWKDAGKSGTKEECLAYVKEVWTDMRPLSLRKKMQEQGLG
jgi:MbtH protein